MKKYIRAHGEDRDLARIDLRRMRDLKKQLIDIFKEDYAADLTPSDTVAHLISVLGVEDAQFIIATMVNTKGRFDKRIDESVYDWAENVGLDETTSHRYGIYYCEDIHPAHMNQIAKDMMRQ